MSLSTVIRGGSVAVIDLINRDNGTNFAEGDWLFGTPKTTDLNNRNTRCLLTATPQLGEVGIRNIYYDRINISEYMTRLWGEEVPRVDIFNMDQLHQIIDDLNWEYSLSLTTDDFDDLILNKDIQTQMVTLTIKPSSLVYMGSMVVELINVDFDKARKSGNKYRVTADGYLRLTI